jgi:two-component system, NarL family, response regulator NreC
MLTIALADDHAVVRQGLRLLLESDPEFVVVGEAANGIEALELVKRQKPDVLIADLMMPGLDGLETTRRVARLKVDTRVVILTMLGDEAYLLDALRSGATGYVVKESCGNDLFQAIRDVRAGRRFLSVPISESFTRKQLQKFQNTLLKLSDRLNPRQQKMLQLVFEGASNRDIGALLKIPLRTVESGLANILGILGLNTRQDITRQPAQRQVQSRKRAKGARQQP